jgi:hypothetical protein
MGLYLHHGNQGNATTTQGKLAVKHLPAHHCLSLCPEARGSSLKPSQTVSSFGFSPGTKVAHSWHTISPILASGFELIFEFSLFLPTSVPL